MQPIIGGPAAVRQARATEGRLSALPSIRRRNAALQINPERWFVYQEMPAVRIDPEAMPTDETRRLADRLFDQLGLTGYKLTEKKNFFARLVMAGQRSIHARGCVMYSRRDRACLPIIDAAVRTGLFQEERSPPGSPRMSRLVPQAPVAENFDSDPWVFDPPSPQKLVILRRRGTAEEIEFDPASPVPADVQRRLAVVNAVNTRHTIVYEPYDQWDDCHCGERRLRPLHYAIFTDDFQHHGRVYTGKFGHQSLRRIERETIRFDGEPSIELDYAGLHCRILYHLAGVVYDDDPYRLWGPATTSAQRAMAKMTINAAFNARDRRAAISACNMAMSFKTRDGGKKSGEVVRRAMVLWRAKQETGLKFAEIYDLARRHHAPIAKNFGSDAGMRLMRIDGAIALDILFAFARRGVPVLSCHDSFIVPARFERRLSDAMIHFYRWHVGHTPVVSGAKNSA